MSRTIDERVVEMQFDNQQFERGANETISTLGKLTQALKLDGSANALGIVASQTTGLSTDLSSISNAVQSISNRFSVLGQIGMNVLSNLTNKATNWITNTAYELSFLKQANEGWTKYEQKTSSVQTIMAATTKEIADEGERMAYVNAQLEKLNWFTDETSYNFVDMVNNIGKFTANNIPLNESVTAMQGIATWAAISGANSQQASRAMYNLSQAMAVGSVKLMDWKSIENATMATSEFKQTALDTAVAMGTLTKANDKYYTKTKHTEVSVKSFNQTLQEGWFSSEVLMSTLDKYGGFAVALGNAVDETGLLTSEMLRYIDEYKAGTLDISQIAKETGVSASRLDGIFKELSDDTFDLGRRAFRAAQEAKTFSEAIAATADAVSTQWMNTFELIFGDYEHAKVLWTELAEELWNVFASGGEARLSVLRVWNQGAGNISAINAVKNAYGALKAIIVSIGDTFKDIFPPMTGERLLEITRKVEAFTKKLRNMFVPAESAVALLDGMAKKSGQVVVEFDGLQEVIDDANNRMQKIKDTFAGLFKIVEVLKTVFITFVDKAIKPLGKYVVPAMDAVLDFTSMVGRALTEWSDSILESGKIELFFDKIIKPIKDFFSVFRVENGSFRSFLEMMWTRFSPLPKVIDIFTKAWERLKNVFDGIMPIFSKIGHLLQTAWESVASQIRKGLSNLRFDNVIDVANVGLFAVLVTKIQGFIESLTETFKIKNVAKSILDPINSFLDGLSGAINKFSEKMSFDKIKQLAQVIAILAGSLFVLSLVDSAKLSNATISLTALMGALYLLVNGFNKISDIKGLKKLNSVSGLLVKLSSAVLILSIAVKTIGGIESSRLLGSVATVSLLLAELAIIASKLSAKKPLAIVNGAKALTTMASAVLILAIAMRSISSIDSEILAESFFVVSLLLGELTAISILLSKNQGKSKTSASALLGMAAAVLVLAGAVSVFGKMDYTVIKQGLVGVTAILSEIAIFSYMMSSSKHLLTSASSVLVISGSLIVLAGAVALFGKMKTKTLLKGLGSILVLLTEIAVAANAMKSAIPGAAAMVIMAGAILLLVPAVLMLGNMDISKVKNVIITIAAVLGTLGAMSFALSGMLPMILGLSASMTALGVGVLALGLGLTALHAGIIALSKSMETTGASFVNGVKAVIIAILETIAGSLPLIADIIVGLVVAVCDTLVGTIPKLVDTVVEILVLICKVLTLHVGTIIGAAIELAIAFINGLAKGIADNAKPFIDAVANLINAILILALEALKKLVGWIPGLGDDFVREIDREIGNVRANMDTGSLGVTAVDGIVDGAKSEAPKLNKYMAFLADKDMVAKLRERIEDGSYENIGTDEIHAIIDGILEEEPELAAKIEEVTGETIDQFDTVPDALKKSSEKSMMSYISGFDTYKDEAYRRAYEIGAYMSSGLSQGIDDAASAVRKSSSNVIQSAIERMQFVAQENSPSRATMKIGRYLSEGLAIGLNDARKQVTDASGDLITDGLNSLQNAAAMATSLFDMTVDLDPVIRPVVDLTEIQNGVDQANGMLDFNSRVGLSFYPGLNPMLQTPYGIQQTPNNVTVNFNVSTQGSLNESDIRRYGREIADVVNYELGRRVG